MIDKQLIEKKLRRIEEYLDELKAVQLKNLKEFIYVFLMWINLSLLKKINGPYFHTTRDILQRSIMSG